MKLDDLLAEYRESLQAEPLPEWPPALAAPRKLPRKVAWWWPAGSVAAGFVLVAIWTRPAPPATNTNLTNTNLTTTATATTATATTATTATAKTATATTTVQSPPPAGRPLAPAAVPRVISRAVPLAAAPVRRPSKVVRRYVALAEASLLPAPSFLQVLRVSVRPERLRALGIAYPDSERDVDAELLVGDDGIARALRLIGE